MNDRERLLNTLDYKPVDRCVYGVVTHPWPETLERWKSEGYDPENAPIFETDRWDWFGTWFFPTYRFSRR